ncbi:MAG: hypothetical protein ACLVCH_11820 [Roseburia inulinivorans]
MMEQPEISLNKVIFAVSERCELKECNVMLDTVEKKMVIFLNAKGELKIFKMQTVHMESERISKRNRQTYRRRTDQLPTPPEEARWGLPENPDRSNELQFSGRRITICARC